VYCSMSSLSRSSQPQQVLHHTGGKAIWGYPISAVQSWMTSGSGPLSGIPQCSVLDRLLKFVFQQLCCILIQEPGWVVSLVLTFTCMGVLLFSVCWALPRQTFQIHFLFSCFTLTLSQLKYGISCHPPRNSGVICVLRVYFSMYQY
jgi:hypothetical protein